MADSPEVVHFPSKIDWIRLDLSEELRVHDAVPDELISGIASRVQVLDAPSADALAFFLTQHPLGLTGRAGSRRVVTGLASWRFVCAYQQSLRTGRGSRKSKSLDVPALHFARLTAEEVAWLAKVDTWLSLVAHVPLQSQLASVMVAMQAEVSKEVLAHTSPSLKTRLALARLLERSGLPAPKSRASSAASEPTVEHLPATADPPPVAQSNLPPHADETTAEAHELTEADPSHTPNGDPTLAQLPTLAPPPDLAPAPRDGVDGFPVPRGSAGV